MFKEALIFFLLNFILCVGLILVNLKDLREQVKKIDIKKILFYAIGSILLALGLTYINPIIMKWVGLNQTGNQDHIIQLIREGSPVLMFFATVIFAAIYEELLFRNLLSKIIKNDWIFVIVSTLLFAAIHVTSNLLEIIPYLLYSFTLSLIFVLSKRNIYSTMSFHAINNLVAFIFLLI